MLLTKTTKIGINGFLFGALISAIIVQNHQLLLFSIGSIIGIFLLFLYEEKTAPPHEQKTTKKLKAFYKKIKKNRYQIIGYPTSEDFKSESIKDFLDLCINNCGDWSAGSNFPLQTFDFEKEVIEYFANKFGTNLNESWGYMTTGGTEGNIWGCFLAREKYPNGVLYYSNHAHYSIAKIIRLLKIPACEIKTQQNGEMDYADLKRKISENPKANPIIFFTIGTTMTGAIDDIKQIKAVLHGLNFNSEQYYLHADCAFSGMILPFIAEAKGYKISDGIDSISVSGHKMIGSPIPCGIALAKKSLVDNITKQIDCIDAKDMTITGSRNGISCLHLWSEINRTSEEQKKQRIEHCLQIAQHTVNTLNQLGVPAWRNPHSVTVVFPSPEKSIWQKYHLATAKGLSHIIITGHTAKNQNYLNTAIKEIAKSYSSNHLS